MWNDAVQSSESRILNSSFHKLLTWISLPTLESPLERQGAGFPSPTAPVSETWISQVASWKKKVIKVELVTHATAYVL